jgi:hypothetical protein
MDKDAINKCYRGQVSEEFQILTFVQDGLITGPGGSKFKSSGFFNQLLDRPTAQLNGRSRPLSCTIRERAHSYDYLGKRA